MFRVLHQADLRELQVQAEKSLRRRKMLNLHQPEDAVQRMFNAVNSDAYFQPHKHHEPDKTETMLIYAGSIGVLEFSDQGLITQTALLSPQSGAVCVDIAPRTWHTIVVFHDGTLIFEAKEGPYDPNTDKVFAPWAPAEDESGASEYREYLKSEVLRNAD